MNTSADSQVLEFTIKLCVYVRFYLYGKTQRVLVAKKELTFYEPATVKHISETIASEIEALEYSEHLRDIWNRVEVTTTQCDFRLA